jgi:hypothetical protein
VHRQAGVDDRVGEDDVASVDPPVEILQEADSLVTFAVARDLDEVERVQRGRRAREVADERNARLERADDQGLPPGVVARDRSADLGDARPDFTTVEEDLADPFVDVARVTLGQSAQDAFRSPKRAARRSKSRS